MNMETSAGILVTWVSNDGTEKHGVLYPVEQLECFKRIQRAKVHQLLPDLQTPERHPENGKKLICLVNLDKLKHIGFVD